MEQQPDGRWRLEPPCVRPLCCTCESDADLWQYNWDGYWFLFCSRKCAAIFARKNNLRVDHAKRAFFELYNGAVRGFSPYDMDDRECNNWGDYDCCDDAEDYGEDDDDNAKND